MVVKVSIKTWLRRVVPARRPFDAAIEKGALKAVYFTFLSLLLRSAGFAVGGVAVTETQVRRSVAGGHMTTR